MGRRHEHTSPLSHHAWAAAGQIGFGSAWGGCSLQGRRFRACSGTKRTGCQRRQGLLAEPGIVPSFAQFSVLMRASVRGKLRSVLEVEVVTQKPRVLGCARLQSSHHEICDCLRQLQMGWGDAQVNNEPPSTLSGWLEGGTRDGWCGRNQVSHLMS